MSSNLAFAMLNFIFLDTINPAIGDSPMKGSDNGEA